MSYKAFISYSHSNLALASALEAALLRFATGSPHVASIRLFRDTTNLSATPELWPDIQKALAASEFFLLLASRDSAQAKWVTREIDYWRGHKDAARLLLVLADGEIAWDDQQGDFDFGITTALPRSIGGVFAVMPLHVDFRGIRQQYYDLNHPSFCDKVATIAAALHGVSKEVLFGVYFSRQVAAEAARISVEADLALRDALRQVRSDVSGGAL